MNEKGSRNSQLSRINEVSFAVDDMLLYLDTHPCDRKALEYCDELVKERRKLLQEYAEKFGPLTIDCTDQQESATWKWMEQPFPWEKEGACRYYLRLFAFRCSILGFIHIINILLKKIDRFF